MSWQSIVAAAAQAVFKAVGGPSSALAATPIGDIETGADALVHVFQEIKARKLSIADAEGFANAVQNILVDAGIEPRLVEEAIELGEAALPVIVSAYASGIVTGGYRPLDDPSDRGHR